MDFLYHYTSIETLALILKGKKIRFNCLKYVDDPEEMIARDIKNVGRLCVVSCWTDIEADSLPMWNMYTPNMKGVKIKMRTFPFKTYKPVFRFPINYEVSYVDEMKLIKDNKAMIIPPSLALEKIVYTDDEFLIKPTIYSNQDGYNLSYVGKYKRACWQFQSEWRYKILFTPFTGKEILATKDMKNIDKNQGFGKFNTGRRIPYKDFYLELSEDAFNGSEITLGPKTSEAERILVEALVEKYQGKYRIPIKKSKLNVR